MSKRKYIVVDSHLGLLTAAVLERLGKEGVVIQIYTDPGIIQLILKRSTYLFKKKLIAK